MDKLHLITVFVSVVEAQSFAGAARKLNISPPAVTRAITALERQLGLALLTRTTRLVRVTDAGARYVVDCRRILAELADADDSVSGMHAAPRGRLTITAPVLFGNLFVTSIVTEYLSHYPEVSASCFFLDRIVNMLDEGVDVAIRIGELPDSSMQAIRVGQVRRVICAAPSYLEQYGSPQTADDLDQHTVISSSGVSSALDRQWQFMTAGEPFSVKVRARLTTTSNDSAVTAAVGGFGLTRLLSYQVEEHIRAGRLQEVLSHLEPLPLPVHVVHHEGRHAAQRVRAFIDLAVERLRANPAIE